MKPVCFVISPIGEAGSPIRENADDLLEFIIRPALEIFDFEVVRGDHRSETNQIDVDVIQMVQDADLCICDITGHNPNVMYELGRRDETMKDVIVMKRAGEPLPVDLGSRRCIEYDLSTPRTAKDAQQQIRSFVEPMIARGFDSSGRATSLRDMHTSIDRLERKIDAISKELKRTAPAAAVPAAAPADFGGLTPMQAFKVAVKNRDLALAERAMAALRQTMDHFRFLDQVVERVAVLGSDTAGNELIRCYQEFMDSDRPIVEKLDYMGCLISYAGKKDREQEVLEQTESVAEQLLARPDLTDAQRAYVYNQTNRVYWGIYLNTEDEAWREKALNALQLAIEFNPTDPSYQFNLALTQEHHDREAALDAIERCLALQPQDRPDEDHLSKAYRMFRAANDPRAFDVLEWIRQRNPALADFLENYNQ